MYRHLANARYNIKRLPAPLHVVVVVFNPLRYQSRHNLFREFIKQAHDSGAVVWIAELALHNRPFEFTDSVGIRRYDGRFDHVESFQSAKEVDIDSVSIPHQSIQFRTDTELWHKEAMINAAATRLPQDWEYVAWVDADLTFINPDWVHETLQQLQHHPVVQMFTHAIDIGPNGEPTRNFQSFAYSWLTNPSGLPDRSRFHGIGATAAYYGGLGAYWHPGFAWAYRREAWDQLGGMLDSNIVGGGDWMMAFGLVGHIDKTIDSKSGAQYRNQVLQWGANAKPLQHDIGAVPGTLAHHFHGPKAKRGYFDRWRILSDNKYNPLSDLRRDWQLLYQLSGNKPKLRDDLRTYLRARNEDSTEDAK